MLKTLRKVFIYVITLLKEASRTLKYTINLNYALSYRVLPQSVIVKKGSPYRMWENKGLYHLFQLYLRHILAIVINCVPYTVILPIESFPCFGRKPQLDFTLVNNESQGKYVHLKGRPEGEIVGRSTWDERTYVQHVRYDGEGNSFPLYEETDLLAAKNILGFQVKIPFELSDTELKLSNLNMLRVGDQKHGIFVQTSERCSVDDL